MLRKIQDNDNIHKPDYSQLNLMTGSEDQITTNNN